MPNSIVIWQIKLNQQATVVNHHQQKIHPAHHLRPIRTGIPTYNGNSFWDKAKELGSFAVAVGKGFLPGADLMACVANGCGYIDWGLAVADVLASFTPAGQALRLYRAFKAGASPNKLRKMQVVPSTCFVAGTLIHTINGLKPIEEIEVGDLVASKNDQTGEAEYKPVVQLFRHEDKTVLNLTFETQDGQEEFIQATPEHPFMLENGQWKNAGYLLPGDTVQTNKNKIVKVKSIATDSQRHKVYNFEVADFHTYFVGETGVWVHNDCRTNTTFKFWSKATRFKGRKVFQRDDLIDPKYIDAQGRTNIERMRKGLAPIGTDGESINLHHMTQKNSSTIAEVTQSFHQKNTKVLHINPNSVTSDIDRQAFNAWKRSYWKSRVNNF